MKKQYNNFLKASFAIATVNFLGLVSFNSPLDATENINVLGNLNWYGMWDSSSTETTRSYTDSNTQIDVEIEYSTNQKWQELENHQGLNIYDKNADENSLDDTHPLWIYDGILRITNNPNDTGSDSAWVKITFSEPVFVSNVWGGSLSALRNRREWLKVSAYNNDNIDIANLPASVGDIIAPSKVDTYDNFFDTTCENTLFTENEKGDTCNIEGADNPYYVGISTNEDGSVTLKGLGLQNKNEYGRAFFEYNQPIQTIVFQHYTTQLNSEDERHQGYTSVAISPSLLFTPVFLD